MSPSEKLMQEHLGSVVTESSSDTGKKWLNIDHFFPPAENVFSGYLETPHHFAEMLLEKKC